MVRIEVREGENIEVALRRFKRECDRNGLLKEVREHEFYINPSTRRKQKKNEALRKARRQQLKMEEQIRKARRRKKGR